MAFRSSSQAAICPPVHHIQWRLHIVPFNAERQAEKLCITVFIVFVFCNLTNKLILSVCLFGLSLTDRESNPSFPFQWLTSYALDHSSVFPFKFDSLPLRFLRVQHLRKLVELGLTSTKTGETWQSSGSASSEKETAVKLTEYRPYSP